LDYTAIIDRLESEIRQYRVEYQRFFNGDAKTPPDEEWAGVRKQLTQLTTISQLSQVDRFRLSGLEGRYNSLSELFRRRLREMNHVQQTSSTPRAADARPASAILGKGSGTEDVSALYDALYSQASTNVALEDFHAYLADQATKVRERTGCTRVRFTVRSDGEGRRLKARPMPRHD